MTNVTIDRAENVIVNKGGIAHPTGWVIINAHSISGTPTLTRGKGGRITRPDGHVDFDVTTTGARFEVSIPLSVAEFVRLTGWSPDGAATAAHRDM